MGQLIYRDVKITINEHNSKQEPIANLWKLTLAGFIKKIVVNFGKKGNLPLDKATVESLVSIVYKIPSYRISDLEISEIFEPK